MVHIRRRWKNIGFYTWRENLHDSFRMILRMRNRLPLSSAKKKKQNKTNNNNSAFAF